MPKPFINKGILFILFLFFGLLAGSTAAGASDPVSEEAHEQNHPQQEGMDIGEVILGHVVDHYSWHIATIGSTHISVPLPVMLYSQERGFFFFWSSRFDHGHSSYKGFKIAQEGPSEGSIVELDAQGNVLEQQPIDFSITKNVAAIFFSILVMVFLFVHVARMYRERRNRAPKGIQSLLEPVILFIRDDVAKKSIGEEDYEKFTPFLLTLFFFILINNLLGLIPIFPAGANVTGNISVTMALALFTFIVIQVSGKKHYWQEIFNPPAVPWWLKIPIPLVPVIEFVGIFIKPFVLMVRLFANISAGHIVMLGFLSLIFIFGNMNPTAGYGITVVSVLFTVFLTFLEILVAFIQAYVFTILSAIYLGMARGHE
jgi:F-type H+-transporting ATPase subunit a